MSDEDSGSTSSIPSVAEERDTISLCASSNANILTPSNMSRMVNNIGSFCGTKLLTGAGQGGVIFCD